MFWRISCNIEYSLTGCKSFGKSRTTVSQVVIKAKTVIG